MRVTPLFRNRTEAGRILAGQLARRLKSVVLNSDALVLALPRGGVPVGFEIAQELHAGLDVFLVRKLGVPGQEELAMGALASGGVRVLNESIIRSLGISPTSVDRVTAREQHEIEHLERLYREGRPAIPVADRTVILVDDGLATGASMLAAVRAVREQKPRHLVVAVPVASPDVCGEFRQYSDDVVCAEMPEPFYAVGVWYEDFSQTSDAEVRELLERAAKEHVS
jgi:putative phosphoribosyl transferase